MNSLKSKVVWITGSGSGIGRAMAVAFAAEGARIALTGRRAEKLEAVASEIGPQAMVAQADVTDARAVALAYQTICSRWGGVDILINNAGSNSSRRHLDRLSATDMAAILDANLKAAFLCSLTVLPGMRQKRSGTMIHIGSMAATMVFRPAGAAYAAAKSGVRQMSAYINAEEGGNGIRSICLNPGEIDTDILNERPNPPSAAQRTLMLQAGDIAATAVFVASLPGRATVSDITLVPTDNQA